MPAVIMSRMRKSGTPPPESKRRSPAKRTVRFPLQSIGPGLVSVL
jgi:hypothetical protein